VEIRVATDEDWPSIYPFYSQIMAEGRTYAFPVHLRKSPGFEVIGTVPEAFDHPGHGLVGLHVMYRRL
jgi:hypothetical protein